MGLNLVSTLLHKYPSLHHFWMRGKCFKWFSVSKRCIIKTPIIQTRPSPASATQQHRGPLRPYRRPDGTVLSPPYPQRDEVKQSFWGWCQIHTVSCFPRLICLITAALAIVFFAHVYLDTRGRTELRLFPALSRCRRQPRAGTDRHPVTAATRRSQKYHGVS